MSSHSDALAKTINNQIRRLYKENESVIVELGTITADVSLSVPSLSDTIPKGEYMTGRGVGKLNRDDVVLVLWVGSEPIVTASFGEEDDDGEEEYRLTPLTEEEIAKILV